jgi:hypothetical protein
MAILNILITFNLDIFLPKYFTFPQFWPKTYATYATFAYVF